MVSGSVGSSAIRDRYALELPSIQFLAKMVEKFVEVGEARR